MDGRLNIRFQAAARRGDQSNGVALMRSIGLEVWTRGVVEILVRSTDGEIAEHRREIRQPPRDHVLHVALALQLALHLEQTRFEQRRALLDGDACSTRSNSRSRVSSSMVTKVTPPALPGRWRVMTRPAVLTFCRSAGPTVPASAARRAAAASRAAGQRMAAQRQARCCRSRRRCPGPRAARAAAGCPPPAPWRPAAAATRAPRR